MADNVVLNPGSLGDTVAADEVSDGTLGSCKVQYVKLMDGTLEGTTKAAVSASGLKVDLGTDNDVTVTGAVTANAGTNLNTSTLALETGGNLAAAASSLNVLDDWDESDRAKVNPIAGQAGVQGGSGGVTALTQRVVLATDVPLPTGSTVGLATATSGGPTKFYLSSAATTNATVVKGAPGQLYGYILHNNATAMRKLCFHDASSSPTPGAGIYFTVPVPAGALANVAFPHPIPFTTGIAITTVTGIGDTDATAVALNDLKITLLYA